MQENPRQPWILDSILWIPDSPCKSSQDSLAEFDWIPGCALRIPGTGFWIPCQWNLDSGLQSLVGFRIP